MGSPARARWERVEKATSLGMSARRLHGHRLSLLNHPLHGQRGSRQYPLKTQQRIQYFVRRFISVLYFHLLLPPFF